jgi:membrane protein DedA with SNARE-associated domain
MIELFSSAEAQSLMQSYGLPLLCSVIVLESIGIPIPSETALVTAALVAGATHQINVAWIVAVAAAAAIAGYVAGYLIGKFVGLRLIARYGRYMRLDRARLDVGQYLFMRHGGKIVLLGRFVPFVRCFAALLAGANRMPWGRFMATNLLGAVAWAGVIGGGSYLLGTSIRLVAGPVSLLFLALAIVLIAIGVVYFRRHEQELEQKAAAALAGRGH